MSKINITIDIEKEIAGMDKHARDDFLQSLSCNDKVIENVISQVIYGCTENGSSGAESDNIDLFTTPYPTPLDTARRFMATMAPTWMTDRIKRTAQCALRQREVHHKKQTEHWGQVRALENKVAELRSSMERAEGNARYWADCYNRLEKKLADMEDEAKDANMERNLEDQ